MQNYAQHMNLEYICAAKWFVCLEDNVENNNTKTEIQDK